jgi:hypothetical protein
MKTETYAGRKISARLLKGGMDFGRIEIKLNGVVFRRPLGFDEDKAIGDLKRELAQVDEWTAGHGVDGDRWTADYFVPGTFEMCSIGHPRDIGGACKHTWCVKHRCHWEMPDDEIPDSDQCRDIATEDSPYCQTHTDLHNDLMDQYREQLGAYQS